MWKGRRMPEFPAERRSWPVRFRERENGNGQACGEPVCKAGAGCGMLLKKAPVLDKLYAEMKQKERIRRYEDRFSRRGP